MFDSRVLETAIGLIFFFLSVSLVITGLQEFIARIFAIRAKMLAGGMRDMMTDGAAGLGFYERLMGHSLVSPLGKAPSYVANHQFSAGVLELLGAVHDAPRSVQALRIVVGNLPDTPFKQAVTGMFREGESDLERIEARLQTWFDAGMARVGDAYKAYASYLSLALGVIFAFGFQLNTLQVVEVLWSSPTLRGAVVQRAGQAVSDAQAQSFIADNAGLFHFGPLWEANFAAMSPDRLVLFAVGCAITAVAVSQGAPFWFNLLRSANDMRNGANKSKAG